MAQTVRRLAGGAVPADVHPARADGGARCRCFPARWSGSHLRPRAGRSKKSGKCTDAIAEDLRIVGTVATPPDMTGIGPKLTAKVSGGAVRLWWTYSGQPRVALGLRNPRGPQRHQGFNLLTVATTTSYVDTQPFPATKTVWSYKAIFRANDVQVGQWSQTVSVAVGG